MSKRIALVGNPNSGKTTLFNALTGARQYVGNWPGVTVEKKEGKLKKHKDVIITDLPGIYSLSPYTLEEVVSRDYLVNERPEVIINVVDASNIERNLYLTTQVLELGIPVVIALNMMDIVKKKGDSIDISALSKALGCPVVEISALKETGIDALLDKAVQSDKNSVISNVKFSKDVEEALEQIIHLISGKVPEHLNRWFAIKLFENDEKVIQNKAFDSSILSAVNNIVQPIREKHQDDGESIITNERYVYIGGLTSKSVKKKNLKMTTSDKIDSIVTNRFLALPIFVAVMFLVYYLAISTIGTMGTDYVNGPIFEEAVPAFFESMFAKFGVGEVVASLVLDGIVAGVGAVLGFIPQIAVLFVLLSILEDIGYMARIAFIMDRIFRKFGLSGKSFIPILIGTGCSVPGIMGTRTIENENDRRMTIIVSSFMPCSAKLPIIALIVGSLFTDNWWISPLIYFITIAGIVVSGIILKKTTMFRGDPAPFIMELPPYHLPSWKNVLLHTWERVKAFATKAGTIILLSSIVLWLMMRFTPSFELISFEETGDKSILAIIGNAIAPIFLPLGFGTWEATVATVTGLIAKENMVMTFSLMTNCGDVDLENVTENKELMAFMVQNFTGAGALSFLLFNLFCIPCFAAVGAIRKEMNSAKWTLIAVMYQLVFAYAVSLMVYQFGILIFDGAGFSIGTVAAGVVALFGLWLLFRRNKKI